MSNEDLGGTVRKHKFGPIVELSDGRKWQLEYSIDKNIDEWVEIGDGDYPEIYFGDGNGDPEMYIQKTLDRVSGWGHYCPVPGTVVAFSSRVEKCSNCGAEQPK